MTEPVAANIDTLVIGASGYVGGELLRLLALHPRLRVEGVVSRSLSGQRVSDHFPHLASCHAGLRFSTHDAVAGCLAGEGPLAVFSAAPHGESASLIDDLLERASRSARVVSLVDLSADFRLADAQLYEATYGKPHDAPGRLADFQCALPDLEKDTPSGPVAHPGCFTTAVTLACAPLEALGLAEPHYAVSAVTGSTGSGRQPSATTHHPERHGNLRAYSPLRHRHVAEMEMLLGRLSGERPHVSFVPHSGPFARGIHATVHVRLARELSAAELREAVSGFYGESPFVSVMKRPPSIKEVVGTNRCALAVEANGHDAVVLSVIDNLTKGAAGGAVQWMNRLLGLDPKAGLELPGWGWS